MDCVRMIVWARESMVGAKNPGNVVMAGLDLSGQVLVYKQDHYNNITEEEVLIAQKKATLDVFIKLKHDVENIFRTSYHKCRVKLI